ncbi:flavin reductase family protein [Gordonia paraffinivorans]|uniref:flavin reductase family protein n=1 Tax=Gordonia paraffinivorans TaxID=175628 RepID=UPI0014488507|nr:flavin reductase family protein [Gordonia paraffinivorans]
MSADNAGGGDVLGGENRFDPQHLRSVFGAYPSGVVALCGIDNGEPNGMVVSTFTSVSLAPPLVSVCIQKTSQTWPSLRRLQRVGVSVLGAHHTSACRSLSSKDGDRFDGVGWTTHDGDSVLIHDSSAWMITSVANEIEAGDHLMVLLEIHAMDMDPTIEPLVFHASGYHRPTPLTKGVR